MPPENLQLDPHIMAVPEWGTVVKAFRSIAKLQVSCGSGGLGMEGTTAAIDDHYTKFHPFLLVPSSSHATRSMPCTMLAKCSQQYT